MYYGLQQKSYNIYRYIENVIKITGETNIVLN